MKIKEGVILSGLQLPMRRVLKAAEEIWKSHGRSEGVTVTSGLDGLHSAGSLHYYGYAVDLRTRYFDGVEQSVIHMKLKKALSDNPYYTVLLEDTHIHVHYLPTGM